MRLLFAYVNKNACICIVYIQRRMHYGYDVTQSNQPCGFCCASPWTLAHILECRLYFCSLDFYFPDSFSHPFLLTPQGNLRVTIKRKQVLFEWRPRDIHTKCIYIAFFQESFTFFNCTPPAGAEEISLAIACSQGVNIRPLKVLCPQVEFFASCRNQQLRCRASCLFLSQLNGKMSLFFSSGKQTLLQNATKVFIKNNVFVNEAENEH